MHLRSTSRKKRGGYCFFHWPTFINHVKARRQDNDRSFQASVMAVCAVAAARLRDGACNELLNIWSPPSSQSDSSRITDIPIISNVHGLRSASLSSISSRASGSGLDFDDLRATALLAILGIQNGDFDQLQIMLGQYHGMSAQLAFHDESQWPEGLEEWEVQERRCLYWSIYTLDVFASSVWGGVIRHRSCQSFVSYPDHRLDDALSLSPTLAGELDNVNWIQGWNTVTDLYRAMEEIMDAAAYQNGRAAPHKPPHLPSPFGRPPLSVIESWPVIRDRYDALPSVFKETKPLTGIFVDNVCSFQAANLSVTLQAVRMAIACCQPMNMADRCQIAGELLDVLADIPTAYMQLISAPFLHQLSAVGSLLGSVVQGPLTISTYLHIRQILLSFANLLACLETPFIPGGGISERLLKHIARIDLFMQATVDNLKPDHHIFRGESPAVSYASRARTNTAPRPNPQINGPKSPKIAVFSHAEKPMDESGPELPFASSLTSNSISQPAFEAVGQTGYNDTVFTLPDDLISYWPLDADQQTIFDSFFAPHNSFT
ncbi:fungal specific transcription factor [Cryptococcus deuterogattii 99/473]|uniref:Fungal specific transcription factor n=1 Tax=Cryptococcus deuterogattii Ram5 TaxID=1296110 RepID=A0A0D0V0C2_9TREE|nr:fungal specific transcription factor [Cryptococcus deuterogattii Ram5]KIY54157.1 fungal specific transcription factor [Cryptococcus deuterogattii 99/473]